MVQAVAAKPLLVDQVSPSQAEAMKRQRIEAGWPVPATVPLALEGEEALHCPLCRHQVKVWWFVDIDTGLPTFGVAPVADDEVRYRQWFEQNR